MNSYAFKIQKTKSRGPNPVRDLVGNFQSDESGALIIFSLFLFVAMLMIGGLAVDFMRFESTRTRLQNTTDRAVLAAASLDQGLDPTAVVNDYFVKAGLSDAVVDVDVETSLSSRRITANVTQDSVPFFLGLVGIDELSAPAVSTAEQSLGNVEISLVLDVSGSMSGSKISSLKTAAKGFVDTIYQNDGSSDLNSMSIITYASQVSAGETLLSKFNLTSDHSYSYCVDFNEDDFLTTEISTTDPIQQTGHFDPYTYRLTSSDPYFQCTTNTDRDILALANDPDVLKDYIDTFVARGATGTEMGIKWGAALLDPSTRPAINSLILDDEIDDVFEDRPADFTTTDTLKVMVVMTDGVNTASHTLVPEFRTGNSDVWFNPYTNEFSVYDAAKNMYYRVWKYHPEYYGTWSYTPYGGSDSYRLTYGELWSKVSIRWNAYYDYYVKDYWNSATYYQWKYPITDVRDGAQKDQLMANICTAAKNQGILLFTIGFQVDDSTADKLEDCATKEAFFYRIEDLDISDAFNSISGQINRLRLTQ